MDASRRIVRILSDARLALDQYELNETAAAVWRLCDGTRTVANIAAAIAAESGPSAPPLAVVTSDIRRLMASLRAEGLVTCGEPTPIDVLFVVPPFPSTYSRHAVETPEYSAPPLGVCYVAAVLREHGYTVQILDLHVTAGEPEDVVRACRRLRPRVVGITATTPSYPNALRVARFAKAWNGEVVTVLGGPHATGIPFACARAGAFDYVCVGEGEWKMLALVDALLRGEGSARDVRGIVRAGDAEHPAAPGLQVAASRRPTNPGSDRVAVPGAAPLDHIPPPARDLLELDRYYQKGAIISSRGCPIDCNFCACAAIVGRTYRVHSIPYVLDEVESMMKTYGYRFFDFHDDTFNLQRHRVFDFCSAVEERRLDFRWGCFCRAAQLTPEMARAMARAGCQVVQFGVEAGDDTMLRAIKKATSTRQIEDAVRSAARAGIPEIVCGFIIGHAGDTEDSVQRTLEFGLHLRRLGATRLTLSLLTPYPGTEVFDRREELGIRLLTEDWEQYIFSRVVIETRHLSPSRLQELYVNGLCKFLDAMDDASVRAATTEATALGRFVEL
jgi:radical SAM superfamily enzyme YgiQ (UPF0313 family)